MNLKALLDVDLDVNLREELRKSLLEKGFGIYDLPKKELLFEEVAKGQFNIIFLNCCPCHYCNDNIIPTIKSLKEADPRAEIICTCAGERRDDTLAIEAIKCGATACLSRPIDQALLSEILTKIKMTFSTRKETHQIETALYEKYKFANMVSKNPDMFNIFSLIRRVAPYYRTLLVTGETGTGKEVLARAIHHLHFSPVSKEPFLVCNCSGLVETLIESELFGHVKGAFTGAISDKKGLFEAAGSGTIFLDEIGHMPLSFQAHFLRVLQDGEFRRVGSTQPMHAKCRVIAATNVDLYKGVKRGLFREDLYFRLAVLTIKLPPLRERKEDIPLLCQFFLSRLGEKIGKEVVGISIPAQGLLMSYDWPGNIRELENALERAVLVTNTNFVKPQDLPLYIKTLKTEDIKSLSLAELEKNHIQRLLVTAGGNKTKAASLLGISRRALLRKTNKHGLT